MRNIIKPKHNIHNNLKYYNDSHIPNSLEIQKSSLRSHALDLLQRVICIKLVLKDPLQNNFLASHCTIISTIRQLNLNPLQFIELEVDDYT